MKNSTASKLITNIENMHELLSINNSFPDESNYPVIKINTSGKILYANHASFIWLGEWLNDKNEYIPTYVIKINPSILNPDADFSISISIKKDILNFDVIGFRESGYIGLYGFNTIDVREINPRLHDVGNSDPFVN